MKIQNAKIKNQNYNAKLKINKIQTPVIASPEVLSTCGHRMSFGHPMSQILINKKRDEAISLNEL